MTKEEILLKIGERIAALSHNASQMCEEYEGYRLACMDISDLLDEIAKELSEPSLPSNLDEAAEEYAREKNPYGYNAFKAGAECMAGQGVNADFEVCKLANRAWLTPIDEKRFMQDIFDNFTAGDKVIVQIRKAK